MYNKDPDFLSIKAINYGKFLVISLGTGMPEPVTAKKYNAEMAAKWGLLGWLTSGGSSPLIDVFTQSSLITNMQYCFCQLLFSERTK
ncbi:Patatin [Thalictrum thalictroides]|uniref:Patatin n=1 Tax=Thalictrum thalictroides TaxID=46969 RepID=A0A7J6UW22_THATH|nr:Patatin [Thalictrum thalictroides]